MFEYEVVVRQVAEAVEMELEMETRKMTFLVSYLNDGAVRWTLRTFREATAVRDEAKRRGLLLAARRSE